MAIQVSQAVKDSIDAIRESGKTNMLDRNAVQRICFEREYWEAVNWIEENKRKYGELIFGGMEVSKG